MTRWLIAMACGVMLLTGCGESRIERKPLVASDARAPQPPADRDAPRPSPHDNLPAAMRPGELAPTERGHGVAEAKGGERPAPEVKDGEIAVDQVRLAVPKAWVQKPPRSGFLLAEFSLPRAEGDSADGRLTVSQAGGSVADNIQRWRRQFGERPEKQSQEKLEVHGIPITLVDFSGTYLDQRGPFTPAVEAPGYRMLGAIADVDGQLYFLKAYGPAKTMAARADEFRAFVSSLKAAGKK